MMRGGTAFLLAAMLALVGCGNAGDSGPQAPVLSVATPEEEARIQASLQELPHMNPSMTVTATEAARIKAAWPKLLKKCPGIAKYEKSMTFKGVERFPDCSTALTYKVTEERGHIPGEYLATGHTCWLCLSDDGNSVSIWKVSCQSLFLDKDVGQPTGQALTIPLGDEHK